MNEEHDGDMNPQIQMIGAIKIRDGLFIGDELASRDVDFLMTNKVTHIINCAGTQIQNLWEQLGIVYMSLPWLEDDHQLLFDPADNIIRQIVRFIDGAVEKGESTLVHSQRGQSRSCCVLTAFMMMKFKWTLYKTLEFLNSRRPDLEIRASFFHQLIALEQKLASQGDGAKSSSWQELSDHSNSFENEELLIRNTFLNAKNAPIADIFVNPSANYAAIQKNVKTILQWRDLGTSNRSLLHSDEFPFEFNPSDLQRRAQSTSFANRHMKSALKKSKIQKESPIGAPQKLEPKQSSSKAAFSSKPSPRTNSLPPPQKDHPFSHNTTAESILDESYRQSTPTQQKTRNQQPIYQQQQQQQVSQQMNLSQSLKQQSLSSSFQQSPSSASTATNQSILDDKPFAQLQNSLSINLPQQIRPSLPLRAPPARNNCPTAPLPPSGLQKVMSPNHNVSSSLQLPSAQQSQPNRQSMKQLQNVPPSQNLSTPLFPRSSSLSNFDNQKENTILLTDSTQLTSRSSLNSSIPYTDIIPRSFHPTNPISSNLKQEAAISSQTNPATANNNCNEKQQQLTKQRSVSTTTTSTLMTPSPSIQPIVNTALSIQATKTAPIRSAFTQEGPSKQLQTPNIVTTTATTVRSNSAPRRITEDAASSNLHTPHQLANISSQSQFNQLLSNETATNQTSLQSINAMALGTHTHLTNPIKPYQRGESPSIKMKERIHKQHELKMQEQAQQLNKTDNRQRLTSASSRQNVLPPSGRAIHDENARGRMTPISTQSARFPTAVNSITTVNGHPNNQLEINPKSSFVANTQLTNRDNSQSRGILHEQDMNRPDASNDRSGLNSLSSKSNQQQHINSSVLVNFPQPQRTGGVEQTSFKNASSKPELLKSMDGLIKGINDHSTIRYGIQPSYSDELTRRKELKTSEHNYQYPSVMSQLQSPKLSNSQDQLRNLQQYLAKPVSQSSSKQLQMVSNSQNNNGNQSMRSVSPLSSSSSSTALHRGQQIHMTTGGHDNMTSWQKSQQCQSQSNRSLLEQVISSHPMSRNSPNNTDLQNQSINNTLINSLNSSKSKQNSFYRGGLQNTFCSPVNNNNNSMLNRY